MSLILNIDTTTNCCSVALSENGILKEIRETSEGMSHSTKLGLFIEEIFKVHKISPKDLSAVAVSAGPGSYTGLRIGVSTAKGICYGADIPLISVSTLQALAYQCVEEQNIQSGLVCPMIDARRMEVYSAIYSLDNKCLVPDIPVVVEKNSYNEFLSEQTVYFCGNGAPKTKEILNSKNAIHIDGLETSARNLVQLAWNKFQTKEFEDLAYYEPFYLKSFVAGAPKKLL